MNTLPLYDLTFRRLLIPDPTSRALTLPLYSCGPSSFWGTSDTTKSSSLNSLFLLCFLETSRSYLRLPLPSSPTASLLPRSAAPTACDPYICPLLSKRLLELPRDSQVQLPRDWIPDVLRVQTLDACLSSHFWKGADNNSQGYCEN